MKTCTAILILVLIASMNKAMADITSGEVSRLYPGQHGRVYFRLAGDTCKTSKYWYFDFSGEHTKAWYSMLLAAGTSGKAVRISHPTCDSTQDQPVYYIYQDFRVEPIVNVYSRTALVAGITRLFTITAIK